MKKIIKILTILLFITGCGAEPSKEIKVVTTIFPYYDFTRAIANDAVDLTMLIDAGADIHTYDPTVQDIMNIKNADLFIYTGGHSDEWVNEIIGEIDTNKTKVIRIMDYLDVVVESEIEGATEDHTEEEEEEYDEHVWTSLFNAQLIVNVIKEELIKLEPSKEEIYNGTAEVYNSQISNIKFQIESLLENANNKTLLFGDRFAFRYFTDEFDLPYYAAFNSCSTETEPSASTVTYLINKIKTENIPTILYLEMSSQKIADTLAEETNVKTLPMYSGQTLSKQDFDSGVTYVNLLERNLETLREVFK